MLICNFVNKGKRFTILELNMKLLVLLFLSFIGLAGYANQGSVKGNILDKKTNERMSFVTVQLSDSDGKYVSGTMSDETGGFNISGLKNGTFNLQISYIGYAPIDKPFSITDGKSNINLQNIYLSEDANVLKELVVEGQQSQMRFEIDKRVFNVGQNIASTGGSASDVLSNIPSVEVDPEGEVSLRGNSSVTIWINGKPSGLDEDNRAQILEQLPAESIDRVELITNPSAKYNPEGTAGIINIILKQDRKPGYYGSVQAGVDTHGGYNLSGNINYTSGKFESFLNIGHRVRKAKGNGYTRRNNLDDNGDITSFLNQDRRDKKKEWPYIVRAGLTYNLSTKDHFTLSLFGLLDNEEEDDMMDYKTNVPGSYISSFRLSEDKNTMKIGSADLSYKRDFTEKSHLDVSTSFRIFDRRATPKFTQTSLFADDSETSSYQYQSSKGAFKMWAAQVDYVNEFGDNKVETGYKGDWARRKSPVETYGGTSESTAVLDESMFNHFKYDQDVHALYATYSRKINRLGVQAGLRGEYTDMETVSLGYGQQDSDVEAYKTDYFSLYPSVFLSYTLPKNNELQLNYTRRVSRPWGRQLNSFKNITDSTNITYGNPLLEPEYSGSFEFNYIKSWEEHTLSASLYYRTTDNVIQRIRYLQDNVMMTTYENVAKTEAFGTEFILKNKLFKILDVTSTLNLYYNKLDGFSYLPPNSSSTVTGAPESDFAWSGRIIANTMLPYGISFQATGNYNSKSLVSQGYNKANGSLDLGLRKSFLDRKLSLTISARDVLDTRQRLSITSGAGFSQENKFARAGQMVNFTLTYSFGNMGNNNGNKNNEERPIQPDNNMDGGDF